MVMLNVVMVTVAKKANFSLQYARKAQNGTTGVALPKL